MTIDEADMVENLKNQELLIQNDSLSRSINNYKNYSNQDIKSAMKIKTQIQASRLKRYNDPKDHALEEKYDVSSL